MRAFALAEIGDSEAIHVFLRREDAWAALAEILEDEPDWAGSRFVVPIELDERDVSPELGLTGAAKAPGGGTSRRGAGSLVPQERLACQVDEQDDHDQGEESPTEEAVHRPKLLRRPLRPAASA